MIAVVGSISFVVLIVFFLKWRKSKKKDDGTAKRNGIVAICSLALIFGLMAMDDEETKTADDYGEQAKEEAAEEKATEEKKAEEEQEAKEKQEKKEKEEAEKEENRLSERDIDEALEEDIEDVKSAELYEGELTLTYEPGTQWSENSFFNVARDSMEEVKLGFEDDDVDEITVLIDAKMTDEKGKEDTKSVVTYRYTRDDFEELEYDNFMYMAVGEEWRILNESDSYFINPGIRSELKDEYTQNLK